MTPYCAFSLCSLGPFGLKIFMAPTLGHLLIAVTLHASVFSYSSA